jgi:NitT/TauT family transport system permease protein
MCFPVIWTNIVAGINNTDKKLLEMARAYGVKKTLVIRRIYIPSIMPYFSAACVTCFGLGWKVSVAAEVLSHPKYSIGSNLYSAKVYLDSSELFAWTLVVIILSIIFEMLFVKIMPIITKKSANTL